MSSGNSRLKARKPKPLKMNRQQELAFSRLVFGVVDSCTDRSGCGPSYKRRLISGIPMLAATSLALTGSGSV
jgi:hypothetical protein